jgi:hypothetical protein
MVDLSMAMLNNQMELIISIYFPLDAAVQYGSILVLDHFGLDLRSNLVGCKAEMDMRPEAIVSRLYLKVPWRGTWRVVVLPRKNHGCV